MYVCMLLSTNAKSYNTAYANARMHTTQKCSQPYVDHDIASVHAPRFSHVTAIISSHQVMMILFFPTCTIICTRDRNNQLLRMHKHTIRFLSKLKLIVLIIRFLSKPKTILVKHQTHTQTCRLARTVASALDNAPVLEHIDAISILYRTAHIKCMYICVYVCMHAL